MIRFYTLLAIIINAFVAFVGCLIVSWTRAYWGWFLEGSIPLPRVTLLLMRFSHPVYFVPIPIVLITLFLVLLKRKSSERAFLHLCIFSHLLSILLLLVVLLGATAPFAIANSARSRQVPPVSSSPGSKLHE